MTHSTTTPSDEIDRLREQLGTAPEKSQLQLIPTLAEQGESGLSVLMEWLLAQKNSPVTLAAGKAYQSLYTATSPEVQTFLQTHFPHGLVSLKSERDIDYGMLQEHLAKQEFQAADKLTLDKLCELAGEIATQRGWLYFTEIDTFPVADLQTIDSLWSIYSEGKFGFSVQRSLWLSVGKSWDKLWSKIGWKTENNWTRYPDQFTWDLTAPRGHLPLSNQLRGVRVIAALLSHSAWERQK